MNCPKCGAPLQEEALYCEKCGQDIQMVPEYDPELEHNLMESIERIAADFSEDLRNLTEEMPILRKKHGLRKVVCTIVGLLVIVAGVLYWQYHSYDYQKEQAMSCLAQADYRKAIEGFERAIAIDSSEVEVFFALAEAYEKQGSVAEYENQLFSIINHPGVTQKGLIQAYHMLIAYYEQSAAYERINELLLVTRETAILNQYQKYLAKAPVFSYESGNYEKVIPLKITSSTIGKIYYTLDGSEPDEKSTLYTAPILLEGPSVTVKAVAVNEFGVVSEVTTASYHIKLKY